MCVLASLAARGLETVLTALRVLQDPMPRGWFEASPPDRQCAHTVSDLPRECLGPQQTNARPLHRRRIVQLHRDLWAECVAECEAAADGVPEYAKGELVYQHSPRL